MVNEYACVHFVVPDIRSGITPTHRRPFRIERVRGTTKYALVQRFTGTLYPSCFGGHSERETPGYIPNPEAKTLSADGTARGTLWESRTPPDFFVEWPPTCLTTGRVATSALTATFATATATASTRDACDNVCTSYFNRRVSS